MKTPRVTLTALALLAFWLCGAQPLLAQGTAFTYQGRLTSGTNVANGNYDLTFALFNLVSGAGQVGVTLTNTPTAVSNGLFTVTLDFGNQFPGADRWLEIAVRTNGGGVFTTLAPRQQLTPTPYAITAGNLSGTLPLAQLPAAVVTNGAGGVNLTGSFTGNGANVTNVNAATLGGLSAGTFWQLGGNSVLPGQFLGSTNNQPLEFIVNGLRALRIEDNGDSSDPGSTPDGAPNMIGGSPVNSVGAGVVGATIAGGGATNFNNGIGDDTYINSVLANFGVVSGGRQNTIQPNAYDSTIGGGFINTIQANAVAATIGGGYDNTIQDNANFSTIGGGAINKIQTNAGVATIGGGSGNTIQTNAVAATIGGGGGNTIQTSARYATIGGGSGNTIQTNANNATIGGGTNNNIAFSHSATIGGGEGNTIQEYAQDATIGGGETNTIQYNADSATIGGGEGNTVQDNAYISTIGGGYVNTIQDMAYVSTIGGGERNTIQAGAFYATIGGGYGNTIQANADYATIPGGYANTATNYAFAAGRRAKAVTLGAFVWADSQNADFVSTSSNQFLVRASGGVGINTTNPVVPLTVEGSGAYNSIAAAAIAVRNTTANKTWEWHVLDDGKMQFADLGAGATRMLIDTNGNVSANTFTPTSDRHAKENFAAVSAQEILTKVAALPISRWNFKQDARTPHLGPMAQDFYAAFALGTDDRHIATVDADGVALAAIQGLNEKVESGKQKAETRIQKLEAENTELKTRLEKLEQLMNGGAK
ncbi:MAG: hypothetical protein EXS35_10340 [Pedosphaera sp.]|nr:hypothetical protein [Pedosphaera sp.]